MKEDSLIIEFGKEIMNNSADLAIDYSQIALADILSIAGAGELVEKLPIAKTVYTMGKGIICVKDYILLKRLLNFIACFRQKKHSEEALNRYKMALQNQEKWVIKLLEELIQMLDQLDDDEKIGHQASLFSSFLESKIDWETYKKYRIILNRLMLADVKWLKKARMNNEIMERFKSRKYDIEIRPEEIVIPQENGGRLQSLGLVFVLYIGRLSDFSEQKYYATESGEELLAIIEDVQHP